MANTTVTQILNDGNENVVIRFVGNLTATPGAAIVLIDPATLNFMGPFAGELATSLRLKKVQFKVEDGLEILLLWDATTPLSFETLEGRGTQDYKDFGGLQNNAGAGKTGKVLWNYDLASAVAPPASGLDFAITLYFGKQRINV